MTPLSSENHSASLRPRDGLCFSCIEITNAPGNLIGPRGLRVLINGFVQAFEKRSGDGSASFKWQLKYLLEQFVCFASHNVIISNTHSPFYLGAQWESDLGVEDE